MSNRIPPHIPEPDKCNAPPPVSTWRNTLRVYWALYRPFVLAFVLLTAILAWGYYTGGPGRDDQGVFGPGVVR
jgi:hypothetical protein